MAILSDKWIREQALTNGMIEPFVEAQRRAPSTRDYIRRRVQIDYAQYVRMRKKLAQH